jgi:hypothetical protein
MAAVSTALITKNLSDILTDSPNLRAWGIRRRDGYPEQIVHPLVKYGRINIEMTLSDDWNAWYCRLTRSESVIYQQICIYLPEADSE